MRQRRYLAYLLRLWLAESAGEPVWRGSLEDPHTGARLGFADLASLFEYLRRQDLETLAQTLAVFAQNAGLPPAQFRADLHTLLTLAGHPHPDAVLAVQAQPVPPLQAPYGPRAQPAGRADWGRAPDVSRFVGRAPELAQLGRWLLQDRRRLLGVFGLGGIGKTFLTRRAALDAAPGFTAVKWVLLQDGPPPDEVLAECIHFFSGYRDTTSFTVTAHHCATTCSKFSRRPVSCANFQAPGCSDASISLRSRAASARASGKMERPCLAFFVCKFLVNGKTLRQLTARSGIRAPDVCDVCERNVEMGGQATITERFGQL